MGSAEKHDVTKHFCSLFSESQCIGSQTVQYHNATAIILRTTNQKPSLRNKMKFDQDAFYLILLARVVKGTLLSSQFRPSVRPLH